MADQAPPIAPRVDPPARWLRRMVLRGLLVVFGLLLVVLLASSLWLRTYVRGESFRQLLDQKTSSFLRADGEYMPLHWSGLSVYSDGFAAHGRPDSALATVRADEIRAEFYPRGVLRRVWQVDNVEMQRLQVTLGGAPQMTERPSEPGGAVTPAVPSWRGWVPTTLDLRKILIREVELRWGGEGPSAGSLRKVRVLAEPEAGGWVFHGSGGALRQVGCPDLSVDRLLFRYQHPQLFIQEAVLRPDETGLFDVSGEMDFDARSRLDLLVKCSEVSITPWLPEDWRARLHGKVVGSAKVQGGLRDPGSMKADGSLSLVSGRLEALPILDRIALFTHTDRFRQFPLQTASADFSWERSKLVVTRLVLESEGLIRIEGGCSMQERNLDGRFQVGVTASSLRWLPGSQSKVFTAERGGYRWAPMRVTGPVDRLQEDLSPRLAAAAETEVIEGARKTIEQGAKGVLDLLSPLIP